MKNDLTDLTVVSFESRHAKTIADLIRLYGGNAVSAPSMREIPLENNREALEFGDRLFAGQIDILVLLTGVGTKALVSVLETRHFREKILDALKKIPVIPRGPKPVRVLNEMGVPYFFTVPEPNTWKELLEAFDAHRDELPLEGKRVAVQEYGVPNPEIMEGLKQRGAHPYAVPVYRWALPEDLEPLKTAIHAIVEGKIQVAVFTTSVQIDHVMHVAEQMDLGEKLKKALNRLVIASVGPDCTQTLNSRGLPVDIEPENSKMGPLLAAVAAQAKEILEKKGR